MDVQMEASDVGANEERSETPAGLCLSPSVNLPSPPLEVSRCRCMLWKVVVCRPPCRPSLLAPKRRKMGVLPDQLTRSEQFRGGTALPSAHPSSPKIIELDEKEIEAIEMVIQLPYDLWDHGWIAAFSTDLL